MMRFKTEHSGAKRGRGAWCRKAVAKAISRKLRRALARLEIRSHHGEA